MACKRRQRSAQSWPSKPVRIIVPVTAGSAIDITARVIAEQLSQQLGQTFMVENRTGAGGTTGMGYVASPIPTATPSWCIPRPSRSSPRPFPISATTPAGLRRRDAARQCAAGDDRLARASTRRCKELVAAAKAKPDSINYATVGYGAAAHLTAERLRLAAGFEAQQIPFRGAPEAVNEVLAQTRRFLLLADARRGAADPRRQAHSARGVELQAGRVAAGGADHGRGRLSQLRIQFLDRHVGAGEDAARRSSTSSTQETRKAMDIPERAGEARPRSAASRPI